VVIVPINLGNPSGFNSLALGTGDIPRIGYYDAQTNSLQYVVCVNASCIGSETVSGTTIGSATSSYGQLYVSRVNVTGGLAIDTSNRPNAYAIDVQGNNVGNKYLQFYDIDAQQAVLSVMSTNFTYRNTNNSVDAFQIQYANGTSIFSVDTTGEVTVNAELTVTSDTSIGGGVLFDRGFSHSVMVLDSDDGFGGSLSLSAGDAGGDGDNNGGSTSLRSGAATGAGTGGGIEIVTGDGDVSGSSGDLRLGTGFSNTNPGSILFIQGADTVATIGVGGAALFQNATDSAAAFQIQDSSDNVLFSADTTTGTLTVSTLVINTTLTVTGSATFNGPTVAFSSNVRGINQAIGNGATTVAINFGTAHSDANFAVQCTPTYNTTCYITNKTINGFTINFGNAAPDANQKVDWFVVR